MWRGADSEGEEQTIQGKSRQKGEEQPVKWKSRQH